MKGESPVLHVGFDISVQFEEYGTLGMMPELRAVCLAKLSIIHIPIANKQFERKMKSTLKRELSVPETDIGELLWILLFSIVQSVQNILPIGSLTGAAFESCDSRNRR